MATTAKEKLRKTLFAKDWTLDTTARRTRRSTEEQNPNVFLRSAGHGGTWRVVLDYSVGYGNRDGDTLKNVHVTWTEIAMDEILAGVEVDYRKAPRWTLAHPSTRSWGPSSILWDALGPGDDLVKRSLRERAEIFAAHPDESIWRTMELAHEGDLAQQQYNREQRQQRARKDRPLPLYEGVRSEDWRRATNDLMWTARYLNGADGADDIAPYLDRLETEIKRIKVLVDPELVAERSRVIAEEKE